MISNQVINKEAKSDNTPVNIDDSAIYKAEDVRFAVSQLHKDEVFEVRVKNGQIKDVASNYKWYAGYFNDPDKLIEQLDRIEHAEAVFMSVNGLDESLLDRADNVLKPIVNGFECAKDTDVKRLQYILIDLDPVRQSGTSSTEAELNQAKRKSIAVFNYLNECGWGKPISAISGNGVHLLYKVDLDANGSKLVEALLKVLALKFSDEKVKIDQSVWNPAQLTKLYGTKACKGQDSADRPHRYSILRKVPDDVKVISKSMIEGLLDAVYESASVTYDGTTVITTHDASYNRSKDWLDSFIEKHSIEIVDINEQGDGSLKYKLCGCPWGDQHGGGDNVGDSCLFLNTNGKYGFHCFHDTCNGRKWAEFRAFYEKSNESEQTKDTSEKVTINNNVVAKPKIRGLVPKSAIDIYNAEYPPAKWIVPDLIPEGLTIFSGKPKVGKSFFALGCALEVAKGGYVLGKHAVEKGRVFYIALEDRESRLHSRMKLITASEEPDPLLDIHDVSIGINKLGSGFETDLLNYIENHPDTRLIIIDTLTRIKPSGKKGMSDYDIDADLLNPLQRMASDKGIGIVLIHHTRKSLSDSGDDHDEVAGTIGITGTVDTSIVMKKRRGQDVSILSITGRDVEERQIAARFNSVTYKWEDIGDVAEALRSQERQQIIDVLKKSNTAMTAAEVTDALKSINVIKAESSVRGLLTKMTKDGEINRLAKGKYEAKKDYEDLFDDDPDKQVGPVVSMCERIASGEFTMKDDLSSESGELGQQTNKSTNLDDVDDATDMGEAGQQTNNTTKCEDPENTEQTDNTDDTDDYELWD
jgi:RecA-family ATPase